MSWAAQYIGIPWEVGAQGPHAYDCLGFFRMVQRVHFGVDLPPVMTPVCADASAMAALVGLLGGRGEMDRWPAVQRPRHGDAVLVHRPLHIGTWLDVDGGGVLHCVEGIGVIFTADSAWRTSGFGRREYFRREAA